MALPRPEREGAGHRETGELDAGNPFGVPGLHFHGRGETHADLLNEHLTLAPDQFNSPLQKLAGPSVGGTQHRVDAGASHPESRKQTPENHAVLFNR
ncbi:hypothetical protein JCM3263A_08760 [Thermobifida fusca]